MSLKKGARGERVEILQGRLRKLGFELNVDGIFGDCTESAVKELQALFNQTSDGIVGEGIERLIDARIGDGWNRNAPDARERAAKSHPLGR